jgi:hypothetical protein
MKYEDIKENEKYSLRDGRIITVLSRHSEWVETDTEIDGGYWIDFVEAEDEVIRLHEIVRKVINKME